MTRNYKAHLELFQCKHVDLSHIEENKRQAAINAAERHIALGCKPMPHVVDKAYRTTYLKEYQRLARVAVQVG